MFIKILDFILGRLSNKQLCTLCDKVELEFMARHVTPETMEGAE